MNNEQLIRQRVVDFIRDHHAWNLKFQPGNEGSAATAGRLESAKAALTVVSGQHCARSDVLQFCLSSDPYHHPDREQVVSIEVLTSGRAVVETDCSNSHSGSRSYVYELTKAADEWRIGGIMILSSGRTDPLPEEPGLEDLASTQLRPLTVKAPPVGLDRLFEGPAKVSASDGIRTAHCERIGEIEVPSGFLAYGDPASWMFGVAVVEMSVPPGRYPVEVIRDDESGRIAAARLVLNSGAKASTWVYATRWQKRGIPKSELDREGTDIVGVDTGRVALVDAKALMALSPRQRELLNHRLCTDRPADVAFSGKPDSAQAVAISSGDGDGVYPSYWALDKDSRPIAFYADFLLLSRAVFQEITVPFTFGLFSKKAASPELGAANIELGFARHDGRWALRVGGTNVSRVVAKSREGRVLFDTKELDSDVDENDQGIEIYMLPDEFPRSVSGELSVQLVTGYRFELVA